MIVTGMIITIITIVISIANVIVGCRQGYAGRMQSRDLEKYFARVGYAGPRVTTIEVLHALTAAHARSGHPSRARP